jgi:hypothetical protein
LQQTLTSGVARINQTKPDTPQPVAGAKDVDFVDCCQFVIDSDEGSGLANDEVEAKTGGPQTQMYALQISIKYIIFLLS